MILDKTTIEERKERSKIKDKRYNSFIKTLGYKDEGELFLKVLQNACISKLQRQDNYQIL